MTSPGYTLPKNKWMDGPYCQHYTEKELIAQGDVSAKETKTLNRFFRKNKCSHKSLLIYMTM